MEYILLILLIMNTTIAYASIFKRKFEETITIPKKPKEEDKDEDKDEENKGKEENKQEEEKAQLFYPEAMEKKK